MEMREAIEAAKSYVADLYQQEKATNYGLEEVRKNGSLWEVTVGFSRPWDITYTGVGVLTGNPQYKREYKIVKVREDDGEIVEMVNRDI